MPRGDGYSERFIVRNRTSRTLSLGPELANLVLQPRERVNLLDWVDREAISRSEGLVRMQRRGWISTRWVKPSSRAAKSVSFVSDADTISAQCDVDCSLRYSDLFEYPIVGMSRSSFRDGAHRPGVIDNVTTGWNQGKHLLYLGAGNSGVIRQIWFALGLTFTFMVASDTTPVIWGGSGSTGRDDLNNWRLRVYTDAGNISDVTSPPASALTVDIPLSAVLGAYYATQPAAELHYSTDFVDVYFTPDGAPGTTPAFCVSLKLPMPFSNGVLVQMGYIDSSGASDVWVPVGDDWERHYNYVTYELGSLPSALEDFRLKGTHWEGDTDATTNAVFLNESSGRGLAAFLWLNTDGDTNWIESNWTFRTDGTNNLWQTAGGEDLFGARSILGWNTGEFTARETGCLHKGSGEEIEAYFNFKHSPVYWPNGRVGFFPYNSDDSAGLIDGNIAFLYYQE